MFKGKSAFMEQERIDEALELLWLLEEEDKLEFNRFKLNSDDSNFEELLKELLKQDMINVEETDVKSKGLRKRNRAGWDDIKNTINQQSGLYLGFTEKGRNLARELIRRHRLAEQLLTDVFKMSENSVDTDACKMEHVLSEELTDSVCTFLGHPPKCPHGKPIPRGECCKKYKIEIEPLVVRLNDFGVGMRGRIVFIVSAETLRLNKLSTMGITAGSTIKLIQKNPSVVIQIDEATIALDPDIAKEIYVKKTA